MELRDDVTNSSLYRTHLWYDKLNNLQEFTENVEGVRHTSKYAYDRDNRITSITYDGDDANKASYTYDELGRVATRTVSGQTSTYSYVSGGYGTNSTTPLVAKIAQPQIPFEYTYDNRGNIISEKRGTQTTTYVYDALGQLIRVNDPNEDATWVYNYDRGGNILSKVRYAYTTGTLGTAQETIPYVYGDSNWKDKLTSYNGQTITYDAIGNPLNDGIWTYEWQAGRQLTRMSVEGMAVSFKYDYNGLRTQKIVEADWYPVTTNYTLHGKLITHMTVDYTDWDEVDQQDVLHFFYDAQSRPAMVEFNGEMYTYVHNLQGDIVAILDSLDNLMVEYKYDAWGKLLSTTGWLADTLGARNPFRYRGYVYDEETALYYLRSRFYSPEWMRFLNSDDVVYLSTHSSLKNAYSYCNLCPIMQKDNDGYISEHAAEELIRNNADFIIDAAEEFEVDPQILAGVIYVEQTLNVNIGDTLFDWLGSSGIVDTSVGIAQVRMSTAKSVEDDGLIEKSTQTILHGVIVEKTEIQHRYERLTDNQTNIRYAAAYLRQLTNAWEPSYKTIAQSPSILGSLYNIGVKKPHSNPKPTEFGMEVERIYGKMKRLLGL